MARNSIDFDPSMALPPSLPHRVVGDLLQGHIQPPTSDKEIFKSKDPQVYLALNSSTRNPLNLPPLNVGCEKKKSGPAVAAPLVNVFPQRETFVPSTLEDTELDYGSIYLQRKRKRDAEAAQKEVTYRAETLEIEAVLGSCTSRKDNITIGDMDLVHEKFSAFMRSHPTLSEGYIRMTGGTGGPSSSVALMPPPPPLPNLPAVSNEMLITQLNQSKELAAAVLLISLLQKLEQTESPEIVPGISAQDNPQPSAIALPRTTFRNLRRMGFNSSEELLPGLPDRRPYTRPDKPYQGPPRGRPFDSGRTGRRCN